MGKKPLLGLVGLCLGLTLTGCKDSNSGGWGWGSRKEKGPAVAHVVKPSTGTPISRKRTVQDQTVSAPKSGAARVKSPYEYPSHSHDVPAPPREAGDKTNIEGVKAEEKVSTTVPPKPALTDGPAAAAPEKKVPAPAAITEIPEPPKLKTGDMVPEGKSTSPVEAEKVVFPPPQMPVKDGLPMKMPSSAEPAPAVKPEPKAVKKDELDLAPMPVKPPELAPLESQPEPPAKPAPSAPPLAPGPDLSLPPPPPPAPALDEKTPMQPLVELPGESKDGPTVPPPPALTPPSK